MKQLIEKILINDAYYTALLADIEKASISIDLEVYIFSHDAFGTKVAEALARAAQRGVRVRVLVDGAGTSDWGGKLARHLEEAGVKVRIYHPLPWSLSHWRHSQTKISFRSKMRYLFSMINRRTHRKYCIIDHDIIYAGSANIAKNDWRDTTIKLQFADVKSLQYAFDKTWNKFPLYERVKLAFNKVSRNPQFRLNFSRHQRRMMYKDLLSRLDKSKKRIWITNAYFMPEAVLLKRLIAAGNRGVDVKIILPNKTDLFVYPFLSKIFYTQLLKAGISIFEYLPSVLHAKTIIIDDWYCVGSSNLNYRSIRHDLEVDVNVRSEAAKKKLEEQFNVDVKASKRVLMEEVKRVRWYQRLFGWLLLYLQYWL